METIGDGSQFHGDRVSLRDWSSIIFPTDRHGNAAFNQVAQSSTLPLCSAVPLGYDSPTGDLIDPSNWK